MKNEAGDGQSQRVIQLGEQIQTDQMTVKVQWKQEVKVEKKRTAGVRLQ